MTEPVLTVLCGMPGSGKSTYAASLQGVTVVSCDDVRAGRNPARVFHAAYGRTRAALAAGLHVVFDACSLQPAARSGLLALGRRAGARCELVMFCVPMTVCATRNSARLQPAYGVNWIDLRAQANAAVRAVKSEGWDHVAYVPRAGAVM